MRTRTIAVIALTVLLGGGLTAAGVIAAAAARPLSRFVAGMAQPLPETGIRAAAQVTPSILRGGQPDSEGFRRLAAMGVRTVVDLRQGHDERAEVEALGMASVSIPMVSGKRSPAPNAAQLRRFFDVVLDPARAPVFVHCRHGVDRTGVLFAAYRMEIDGWTPAQALEEMRALGFADDHPHLAEFVRGYESRGFASAAR